MLDIILMNKLQQSYMIMGRDPQFEGIQAQIDVLDRQNKKLISIADNILKTSFLRATDQKPAIILQFEEDMRASFNALINSIREFFISIDEKLEQIGEVIQSKFEEGHFEKARQAPRRSTQEESKIEMVMERMNILEQNLKKTQENESKLISIIEAMATKHNQEEEQPTMVRSGHKHNYKDEPKTVKSHENSFRLFSIQDLQGINTNHSSLNQLDPPYHMVSSQASSRGRELERQETFKFNNFCMPKKEESKHSMNENFLMKREPSEGMDNSNRIHRLSALMKALKE